MDLSITANLPTNVDLYVFINNSKYDISNDNKVLQFSIPETDSFEIRIEKPISRSELRLTNLLFYFFTILLRSVGHIVLLDADSTWYEDIQPFKFKVRFFGPPPMDGRIFLTYKPSKCIRKNNWTLPTISISPHFIAEYDYALDELNIRNALYRFIKKLTSVSFLVLLILTIFMFNTPDTIGIKFILGLVMALIFGIQIFVVYTERKRMREIISCLNNQTKDILPGATEM